MKIVAVLLIALTSALAYGANRVRGPASLPAPEPELQRSLADARPSREFRPLAVRDEDRPSLCTQQARSRDLQGDDYRLFVIRCVNAR
ncbi:MAG TPA: hypothetical protein VM369_00880 [Candidatus Binatia bacterium]|nr:hypothetical protein [Candidatus Binatia bacterium]